MTVSLSGRDLIVDTEAVGRYLTNKPLSARESESSQSSGILIDLEDESEHDGSGMRLRGGEGPGRDDLDTTDEGWKSLPWKGTGIDVLWFKDLDHAQVFDKPATRRRLINAIRSYCEGD